MSGVFDLAGPVGARDIAPTGVAFPMNKQGRHPDFQAFVGSRSGAVSRRSDIPGAPRFLWDWTH